MAPVRDGVGSTTYRRLAARERDSGVRVDDEIPRVAHPGRRIAQEIRIECQDHRGPIQMQSRGQRRTEGEL